MSSKKRRAKKKDAEAADEGAQTGTPATGDESAEDSPEPSSTAGSKSKKADSKKADSKKADSKAAESKRSLPAFGFAGDLLKKKDADADAEGSPEDPTSSDGPSAGDGGEDEHGDEDQAVTDRLVREMADEADDLAPEEDPHRIFSFADQIQSRQERQEKEKGPKARWETWVTFRLDDETFALPVEPVRQVVRVSTITRVPHAPRPVRGVTNLRGRVIPVIDLRMRVGLDPGEITRQSRVVAVASRGRLLGLLVDAVHQVVHLDLNQVQPPPEDVMTVQSDYILGVYHQDDSLILLLDVDRALVLREEAA